MLRGVIFFGALLGGAITAVIIDFYIYNIAYFAGVDSEITMQAYLGVGVVVFILSLIRQSYFCRVNFLYLAPLRFLLPEDDAEEDEKNLWRALLGIILFFAFLVGIIILVRATLAHTIPGLISSGVLFVLLYSYIYIGIMPRVLRKDLAS